MAEVGSDEIAAGLARLGFAGQPVCLHSSLRSFGSVGGGADAVVDAFLGAGCTLVVPSFSWRFAVQPVEGLRPQRNGWNYDELRVSSPDPPGLFTPVTREVDRAMGAIPAAVVRRSGRARGDHPLASFTAVGPLAVAAIDRQTWDDPYAPLRWLAQSDGHVLLAGVSLTALTLAHYAEQLAGRTPFRRWVLDVEGEVRTVPVGGCSNGFEQLRPALASLERTDVIGKSLCVSYQARPALAALTNAIRERPEITRCADSSCLRCRDAITGGPLL